MCAQLRAVGWAPWTAQMGPMGSLVFVCTFCHATLHFIVFICCCRCGARLPPIRILAVWKLAFLLAMQQAGPDAGLHVISNTPPRWLSALLTERFFVACDQLHDLNFAKKKNEKNSFCLDCMCGVCQHCLSNHSFHHVIQIRRYVYHDVIRLQDIQKLFDCSRVQTYVINSAKVVFLNERPQPKSSKALSNTCQSCERSLQDAYKFCSVACKVEAVFNNQAGGLFRIRLEKAQDKRKRRCSAASESRSSSGVGVSEVYNAVVKSDDMRISHHKLQCREEQQQYSPTSSECSSATEEYGFASWEQYDAEYLPSFLLCQQTGSSPTMLPSDRHSLHCHLRPHPISNNTLSCSISKHVNSFRYQSVSPRSVFIPTSLSRRKSKPHRSPLS